MLGHEVKGEGTQHAVQLLGLQPWLHQAGKTQGGTAGVVSEWQRYAPPRGAWDPPREKDGRGWREEKRRGWRKRASARPPRPRPWLLFEKKARMRLWRGGWAEAWLHAPSA